MWVVLVMAASIGCSRETLSRNCASRVPFYPDADGDGVGEPTAVYVGCEPPDGWVQSLEPYVTPTDTASPTGDTGSATATGDTGSTDTASTATGDTATGDTGAVDTAVTGTDTAAVDTAIPSDTGAGATTGGTG